jgi:hypothetical protein
VPKASIYEPRIVELLRRQPMSTTEVATAVGCTRQQAHNILNRIATVADGLTASKAKLWQLRDDYPTGPGRTVAATWARPPVVVRSDGGGFQAGGTYTVQKVEVVEGRLIASLVDMAGARIDVEMEPAG